MLRPHPRDRNPKVKQGANERERENTMMPKPKEAGKTEAKGVQDASHSRRAFRFRYFARETPSPESARLIKPLPKNAATLSPARLPKNAAPLFLRDHQSAPRILDSS